MQLEYESKNLVLEKIALYLPKKNMNASETTARIPWVGGNKKLAKFEYLLISSGVDNSSQHRQEKNT